MTVPPAALVGLRLDYAALLAPPVSAGVVIAYASSFPESTSRYVGTLLYIPVSQLTTEHTIND
jgi:hypothetical protein